MNVKVEFSETSQEFDVAARDNSATFPADMGQTTVLYNGQNGATFIPKVSESGVLSWTNDKGLPNPEPVNIKGGNGKDGKDGKDGIDGKNGKDGDTPYIQNGYWYINGVNTNVKAQGADGKNGTNGKDGADGYTPVKGVDYFDGKDGAPGANGKDGQPGKDGQDGSPGKDGADGYTPIKGTDYFTEADKAEMVSAVIAALPVYDGEVVAE